MLNSTRMRHDKYLLLPCSNFKYETQNNHFFGDLNYINSPVHHDLPTLERATSRPRDDHGQKLGRSGHCTHPHHGFVRSGSLLTQLNKSCSLSQVLSLSVTQEICTFYIVLFDIWQFFFQDVNLRIKYYYPYLCLKGHFQCKITYQVDKKIKPPVKIHN